MKKIFKKNQLMITALALMIAVAGYLHFSGDVSDQITISEGEGEEQAENTASEAANMIEYTVEDTYTADELAEMDAEASKLVNMTEKFIIDPVCVRGKAYEGSVIIVNGIKYALQGGVDRVAFKLRNKKVVMTTL